MATVTYETAASTDVAGTVFTFNDLPVVNAAPDAKRKLLVAIGNYLASGTIAPPTSVTVNGVDVTANLVATDNGVSGSSHSGVVAYYLVDFPTGTDADVVFTYAISTNGGGVALYSLEDADDWTLEDQAEYVASVSPMTGVLTVLNGDHVFNIGINRVSSGAGRRFIVADAAIIADDASYDIGYGTNAESPVGLTIRVNNNIGPFASGTRLYTFSIVLRPFTDTGPSVSTIVPDTGSTAGGTPVTLTGSGLTGATGVLFDASAATDFLVVSDTEITCETPAHAAGVVDVTVQHPSGDVVKTAFFEFTDADTPTHITQVPLLVIDNPNQQINVTQIPLLVVTLPIQGAKVTQVPVLSIFLPTPIPLPKPVVPEVPVVETWTWNTVIQTAEGSREQRTRLRETPRYGMKINALILSEKDRRDIYQLLFKFINREIEYPFYQYSAGLTAAAVAGATKLFFDPARTDMRDGETMALFDPQLEVTHYLTIDAVEADGATLAEPLEFDVPRSWLVCPAIPFRVPGSVGLNMRALDGSLTVTMESTRPRAFERPGAAPSFTTLNGLPILTARPRADNDVDEAFIQEVEWLDNEISVPLAKSSWPIPFVTGEREYVIRRPDDLDYWRGFADELKGRQNPFLLPTFRDDLPLTEAPALGSNEFTTSNVQYFDYWLNATYRYLQIVTANETLYRRVMSAEANYDADGQPISVTIRLDTAFGGDAGDNVIRSISFMNICRLESDTITLTHQHLETNVRISVRAINE